MNKFIFIHIILNLPPKVNGFQGSANFISRIPVFPSSERVRTGSRIGALRDDSPLLFMPDIDPAFTSFERARTGSRLGALRDDRMGHGMTVSSGHAGLT
jgi:hypothetical protein